jgi:hypothetical protein
MGKIFGCFGVILLFPILIIGLLFFNAWYLQVIYNIGFTPLFGQFEVFLPQLSFWTFVFISVLLGAIKILFVDTTNKNEATKSEKKTYNISDKEELFEGILKLFSPILSNILTKLLQLGLLAIFCNICF